MDMQSLKALESRVEDVLARHSSVRAERDRLQEQLSEARARIEAMSEQIRRYEKERAEMKARVERILGRLDGLHVG
jgi:chromosome segregation ATPase